MNMFIPLPSLVFWAGVILLGRRFLWLPAKSWLEARGYELSFRLIFALILAIAASVALVSLGANGSTVWGGLILLVLFVSARKLGGIGIEGGAGDVIAHSGEMKALAAPFDPEPHIRKTRKAGRDQIFLGLGADRSPILFDRKVLIRSHAELLGESGSGKSSLAGVLLSQLAAAGECVVVFDPKADRMLPGVLARAGREHGFPVINIDLRYGQPAQLNPFLKARRDQVEELLQVALDLGKTGNAGVDFYRGKDREATGWMAQAFEDGETSMPELLQRAAEDERVTENENLWREFRQIARIHAFQVYQAQGGHDIEELLSRPGVIYVTGSTTKLEVQAAQKLLLQRILQILDERSDQSMPVAIFLDELKYILSAAALRAAGTIRDRNCHLIFAHQSLGDLADCPGLEPKAVRGAVWGNCGIKIAYKMLDAETARELSIITGERAVMEQSESQSDNGKTVSKRIGKASHMPSHVFTHLPKPTGEEASVGVVIGDGPAYFLSTRWLPSEPHPNPIPAPPRAENSGIAPAAGAAYLTKSALDPDARDEAGSPHTGDGGRANSVPDHAAILAADFNDLLA